MKQIKVLGAGCASCKTTVALISKTAEELGKDVELEKIDDLPTIMSFGLMSTLGVVVDGQVVHAGGVPSKKKIHGWLSNTDN